MTRSLAGECEASLETVRCAPARASAGRNLFFEGYLHPVRRLDLDNPVGPVLARPLYGHIEPQAGPLAGSDRCVHVADAELPGQGGCTRIGSGGGG
jgi:hypothetical protein